MGIKVQGQSIKSSMEHFFFQQVDEMGNIYRTTYNAFSVVKHSGSIQPQETEKVKYIITIKKLIIHKIVTVNQNLFLFGRKFWSHL